MSVRISCPSCDESYAVDDSLLGKRIRCRGCKEPITVQRPRREDDEDKDDRPERRVATERRRRDEDEDEAPRRRAARPAQDEDRPRRAKGKEKSGGVSPALIVGGVAGVLLLVGAVIGGVYLLNSSGPSGPVGPIASGQPKRDDNPATLSATKLDDIKGATVYLRVNLPGGGVAEGTGFCVAEPGIVVTNAHVLGMLSPEAQPPASVAAVVRSGTPAQGRYTGQVLGVDRANDLAVLRMAGNPAGYPEPLRLGTAASLTETQKVYIFGFPLGEQLGQNISVSESSVSSLRQEGNVLTRVQVNGGMHPGNSGGPVTDSKGDVVGVSVAVIRGTQLNFAIPAEFVHRLLAGLPGEVEPGAPYTEGGKTLLPVRMTTIDPLGRVKEVKVEVFAGSRETRDHPRDWSGPGQVPPSFGDGPRLAVVATRRGGAYTAEAPVPATKPDQLVYAQIVVTTGDGASRWGAARAVEFRKGSALQRQDAALYFKAPADPIERTIRLQSHSTMTLFRGKESIALNQKMDGHVLEQLIPDTRGLGTGVRLTVGRPTFTREVAGRKEEAPAALRDYLSRFSPTFLVNAKNEAKERGNRSFAAVPEESRDAVESLFETVCNTWEMTTLPLPNRTVRHGENWPARVPMLVQVEDKRTVQFLHLTCTYEGRREGGAAGEGYVRLAGVVKAPEARGDAVLGKVSGHAVVDLDKGFLREVRVALTAEVDTGSRELRMLITDESTIERVDGNPQGIKPAVPAPPKKGK